MLLQILTIFTAWFLKCTVLLSRPFFRSRDQDRDLGHQVSRPRPRSGSSGLETKTETLDFRSRDRDRDLDKMNSSLETMVSKSQHWLHQFQLVTEHSLKGATNYGNCATDVGTKHDVLRPRLRPGSSGLEIVARLGPSGLETETWAFRSWDQDLGHQVSRPRPRPGQNELECTRVSRPWSWDHNTGNVNH